MAYVMGRGGETIHRIRRCSGIAYEAHRDGIILFGTDEEIACARLGIRLMLEMLREGRLSIDLQAPEVQEKLASVDIPIDSVGFVVGKDGVTFRRIESRHSVLMFGSRKSGRGLRAGGEEPVHHGDGGESRVRPRDEAATHQGHDGPRPPRRLHDFGRTGDRRDRPYERDRHDAATARRARTAATATTAATTLTTHGRTPMGKTRDYMSRRAGHDEDYERNLLRLRPRPPYHDHPPAPGPGRPRGPPPCRAVRRGADVGSSTRWIRL